MVCVTLPSRSCPLSLFSLSASSPSPPPALPTSHRRKLKTVADDLPLNVSRETLQSNKFLSQLQRILVRKAIDLFTRLAGEDTGVYQEISKLYGNALRIGMLESKKDKVKIAKLLRFESTRTNFTSLEEVSEAIRRKRQTTAWLTCAQYVENRKEGQKQVRQPILERLPEAEEGRSITLPEWESAPRTSPDHPLSRSSRREDTRCSCSTSHQMSQ